MSIKQKIYLIFAVIVTIFIVLTLFVIKPLFLEIKKTAASVLESRERLMSLEGMDKKYVEEVEADYKDINDKIIEIKKQLIDKNEAVKFFEALESVASSTNNEIEISASEFPSLTLGLFGTFPNFMKFLGWLENGDYFIDVNSVNITRTNGEDSPETISAGTIKSTLKIRAYTNE
ncbi:MAG: hypothetical protein Q8N59_00700 [bacterium]|nr:hypothetical protein [bacterium]